MSVKVSINSLVDKVIIINTDSNTSVDELTKKVTEALNAVITLGRENQELDLSKSSLQSSENDHLHSPE